MLVLHLRHAGALVKNVCLCHNKTRWHLPPQHVMMLRDAHCAGSTGLLPAAQGAQGGRCVFGRHIDRLGSCSVLQAAAAQSVTSNLLQKHGCCDTTRLHVMQSSSLWFMRDCAANACHGQFVYAAQWHSQSHLALLWVKPGFSTQLLSLQLILLRN
jgi:hypothetical protein